MKAFQLGGGASGRFFPVGLMDIPFSSVQAVEKGMNEGTGSVRFISEEESLVEICTEISGFFSNESCGKCTPCRWGGKKLYEMLKSGICTPTQLRQAADYIVSASFCALGKSSCNALLSALDEFPEEFAEGAKEE